MKKCLTILIAISMVITTVFVGCAGPLPALSYAIVDTGQTKCYDNSKEIPCPRSGEPFYGQDAQYQGNQPAYKDNGDGTITDLNTGLMWVQARGSKVTYDNAISGASSCRVGGYSDWRMPTIKELYSLINFNGGFHMTEAASTPYIDTRYFGFKYGDESAGERLIDCQDWSATQYIGTTMGGNRTVFGVNFADGVIKGYPRDYFPGGKMNMLYVRYVRGNPKYGINDFIDNGDGTISDKATGLMWSKGDSGTGMNWQDALAWVQKKNTEKYLGHNDWRLPNAKELQSIVDYTRAPLVTNSAAINPIFSVTTMESYYWTGTTQLMGPDTLGGQAVYVAFGRAMGYMPVDQEGKPLPPPLGGPPGPGFGPPPGVEQQSQASSNYQFMDVHGAGAQRMDPKAGNPADYPHGRGPQGDDIRIYNYVRCVRNAEPAATFTSKADFSVITLGTGGPLYNPERSGPSALVHHKDNFLLIDMGNNTQASLNDRGISLRDVSTLTFTHHHIDHNEEFFPMQKDWYWRAMTTGGCPI